jgi:hypothetical protein
MKALVGPRSIADEIREELPNLPLDADTKKAIETWLQMDREFNAWFLVTTKRALGDDDLMELLGGYGESQETVANAWSSFRDEQNGSKLHASMAISIARMQTLMNK